MSFLIILHNMIIRKIKREDLDNAAKVMVEAMNANLEGAKITFNLFLELGECLLAEEEGEIIATACYIPYKILSWIGNVAVKPRYQRKGYGKRLMSELLKLISTKVIRLDSTTEGYRLYRSLGFIEEYKTILYELRDLKGSNNVKTSDKLEDWMMDLDKKAFGDDRGKLLGRINGLILYTQGGYGILSRNILGPLVAEDDFIAESIIRKAVELGARIIITIEDKTEFIEDLGGRRLYTCTRMMLGESINENRSLIYGIYRYAFG